MIKPLNTLRFLLMMIIFVHHLGLYYGGGSLAVSAFFILSGFCLSLGYGERVQQEDFDYVTYLKKRLAKFYPIHWICLAAFIGIGFLCQSDYKIHLRPLIANILLLQSWVPDYDFFFSYNAVAWYLSDAVFMAAIFPLLYPTIAKLGTRRQLLLFGWMGIIYCAMVVFVPGGLLRMSLLYINPLGRCFEFIIGMLTYQAYLYFCNKLLRIGGVKYVVDSLIVFALTVAIIISIINRRDTIGIGYWIPLSVMILCVVLNDAYKTNSILDRIMRHPISLWVSQCAMSFFLIHFIVISYWHAIWNYQLETFIVSFVFAQISYYLIEKKLTKWIQQKI